MKVFNPYHHILFCVLLSAAPAFSQAQNSVLHSGVWHKIEIEKTGVHKIDYSLLSGMGIDPSKIDPRKLKIFGNEGGMLPQRNSDSRPNDLIENSIFVAGEADGKFDTNDYIIFYAQGADRSNFLPEKNVFKYEHNLYADKNYYFVTIGDTNGKRISHSENLVTSAPIIDEFNDFFFYELDKHNELTSGREWFGEKFDATLSYLFKVKMSNIIESSTITVVSDVMAQSYYGSSFAIRMNGTQIGEQYVLPIPNAKYASKGRHQRDTIVFTTNSVSASGKSEQEITYQYTKSSSGRSIGYLDFLLVNATRKLALYDNQTQFRSKKSLEQPTGTFRVENVTTTSTIWDITNPYEPKEQAFSQSNGIATFTTTTENLNEYIVFNSTFPAPKYTGKIENQNLHGISVPNLLIISHPDFIEEAKRLANHRETHDGFTTAVFTTEHVYHEFSSGRQDVTAIRDFAKYLYAKSPGQLKSLLLFGKCSYDYKDRVYSNTNFVPTYESRNSLHPLETYSSDDYFGFLENHEGNWGESPAEYHTLDIGVGRLPVKNTTEAKNVVDKLIQYDTEPTLLGKWRNDITFVADDGDFNIHQNQSNQLSNQVATLNPSVNAKKIFVDAYEQILKPGGETAPSVNKAIEESLDRGSLIVNYTGHGGEKLWAQEKIFDDFMIETLTNKFYPLFVTATCEFGRHDDPGQISSAEICITRRNSGAIGMVTTARPVNASTNFELNKAFYDALFEKENGKAITLGEVFLRTKNNSISGVSNRNFSLLGDPSMTLAFPSLNAHISEIKTKNDSDTLKALSTVVVKGAIMEGETIKTDFEGTVFATLFDKETSTTTFGNENPPFTYKTRTNALFRGKASVVDGLFEFEFIVPKNIAYQVGAGKLSIYAADPLTGVDAGGVQENFAIGKSESFSTADTQSPSIQAFMGDATFINGGIISPNSTLVVKISDVSGVNISNYGIGNSIMATLDDAQIFVLNDYYESETDDFTTGWIHFPMKDLSPGQHQITVRVWDTYNNPGEATVNFVVTDGNSVVIETFRNYPNPFREQTQLYFTHNRPGDDLQASVTIMDITGSVVQSADFTIYSSPYRVDLLAFDVGNNPNKKQPAGLYLARLHIRSITNGSKNEQVTKLIIVK